MKSQTRLLPRLDQLYLQKKSYQIHRKKLSSIQRSKSFSKRSLDESKLNQNEEEVESQRSLNFSEFKILQPPSAGQSQTPQQFTHMQTIQQAKPGLSYWLKKMNPHQKRLKQEQIKENKRIRQKIKNTMSFIHQSNKLDSHEQHYSGMKRMLTKFSVDNQSNKPKLKCEIVLKKINEIEKEKLKLNESRILQLEKNERSTQMLKSKNETQEHESFLTKRSKKLTQKINILAKQGANTMKDNIIAQPLKQNFLSRNKSQLASKTNSLIKSLKDPKTFIPKINGLERHNRIRTQQSEKPKLNRLFNTSKLSNLSIETTPEEAKLKKEYRILKVNLTQPGSLGFKKMPPIQTEHFSSKDKILTAKMQKDPKNFLASRIKTQANKYSASNSISRQKSLNTFDYQKKRIQRYLKSKSSLTIKDINTTNNKYRILGDKKNEIKMKECLEAGKNGISLKGQQKIQQTITIEQTQKQQKVIYAKKNVNAQNQQPTYFATQIQ